MRTLFRSLTGLIALTCVLPTWSEAAGPVLVIPAADVTLTVTTDLPESAAIKEAGACELTEEGAAGVRIVGQLVPAIAEDGTAKKDRFALLAAIPPRAGAEKDRRFRVRPVEASKKDAFHVDDVEQTTLKVSDGGSPVFAYNYRTIDGKHVPDGDHRKYRTGYIHPVWGLDGAVITDDFPQDHFHHHGIFWSWPYIGIDGKEYDSWENRHFQPKYVRWITSQAGLRSAVLAVENGWFLGTRKVMIERVWMRTYKAADDTRVIDLDFFWTPVDRPVSLRGRGGKSYGGLTIRANVWPRKDAIITTPQGATPHVGDSLATSTDLVNTPLPWADISSEFPGGSGRSGVAFMVHPEHPDFPPTWLTRHYGPLCVGWPGIQGKTFEPGKPFWIGYRVLIHKGELDVAALEKQYQGYTAATKTHWEE